MYLEVSLNGELLHAHRGYGYSVQEYLGEYRYAVDGRVLVERWSSAGPTRAIEEPRVSPHAS